eukprot:jgi/Botrbrau1/22672/Bobra.0132s0016.1
MGGDADISRPPSAIENPGLDENLNGHSTSDGNHYTIQVSNANGYLCHIHLECVFRCDPSYLFSIFTNPDNTRIFRDIKEVTSRTVLDDSTPGLKVVEVEQLGEAKILWLTQRFRTLLKVTEDARDPKKLVTTFSLIRSDILSRFNGCWTITPREDVSQKESCTCTFAVLEQDILPAGVPAFLKHVPVLGHALRGISVRAVKRLVEDIDRVIDQKNMGVDVLSNFNSRLSVGPTAHAVVLDDSEEEDDR